MDIYSEPTGQGPSGLSLAATGADVLYVPLGQLSTPISLAAREIASQPGSVSMMYVLCPGCPFKVAHSTVALVPIFMVDLMEDARAWRQEVLGNKHMHVGVTSLAICPEADFQVVPAGRCAQGSAHGPSAAELVLRAPANVTLIRDLIIGVGSDDCPVFIHATNVPQGA